MSAIRYPAVGQRRLMLLIVVAGAAFVLFFPARQLIEQRRESSTLQHRLATLRAENGRLEREVSRLSDRSELEVLARERLGLVKPGEHAFYISPQKLQATPASSRHIGPSAWERGWEWLTSHLRGHG